ncbi:MAG: DUF4367 domain-containing protein [Acetatifactor sp.]|nr:DUF4367 domain-containing protein [Acetatifactor sp.]
MMDELKLTNALKEADLLLLQQTPTRVQYEHEFSSRFHRKIRRLIRRETNPVLYRVGKAAATILLLLTVAGGILLGTNEKVRADFVQWIMRIYSERLFGYYSSSNQEIDISQYTMENIVPKEYGLVDRIMNDGSLTEIYMNLAGEILSFTAVVPDGASDFYIACDENGADAPIMINELNAEVYISKKDGESNAIVWTNEEGVLMSINGYFDEQELISFAVLINK